MVVWEVIRLRLSLMGDGDTGSPLSRLRARDTALVGTSGKLRAKGGVEADEEGCVSCIGGKGSGERVCLSTRLDGCDLPKGLERDSLIRLVVIVSLPFPFCFFSGENGLNVVNGTEG